MICMYAIFDSSALLYYSLINVNDCDFGSWELLEVGYLLKSIFVVVFFRPTEGASETSSRIVV